MAPSPYPIQLPVSVQVRLSQNKALLICSTYFLQQAQPCAPSALRLSSSTLCLGPCPASPLPRSGRWDTAARGRRRPIPHDPVWQPPTELSLLPAPLHSASQQKQQREQAARSIAPCYAGATGGRLHPFTFSNRESRATRLTSGAKYTLWNHGKILPF